MIKRGEEKEHEPIKVPKKERVQVRMRTDEFLSLFSSLKFRLLRNPQLPNPKLHKLG
jgi:hypothetical protein